MLKGTLIGNLGSDPEMKYAASGTAVLQLRVASNYRVRDSDGNWSDATEWVRVSVFGKRAESLAPLLKKGTRVYCDGRLEARPWLSQNTGPQAGLELIADTVEFMSSRQDGESRGTVGPVTPLGERSEDRGDLDELPW